MGLVAGKKLFSIMALCAMIGLLLLPIAVSLPTLAMGADAPDAVKKDGEAKVEGERRLLQDRGYRRRGSCSEDGRWSSGLSAIQLRESRVALVCKSAAPLLRKFCARGSDFLHGHRVHGSGDEG